MYVVKRAVILPWIQRMSMPKIRKKSLNFRRIAYFYKIYVRKILRKMVGYATEILHVLFGMEHH